MKFSLAGSRFPWRCVHRCSPLLVVLLLLTPAAYTQARRHVANMPRASASTPSDVSSGFLPGLISIFAGNGTTNSTFVNDSLPTSTSIGSAGSVAVDSQGDIVIAEVSNQDSPIYMVYAGGSVPPILAAVTTNASPAITPTKGHIYRIDCSSCNYYKYGYTENAPLSKTEVNVGALWFDSSDNLYITDQLIYYSIFKVDHTSGNVTQVAGVLGNPGSGQTADNIAATSAYLMYPTDVRTDTYGNIYIVDSANTVVLVVYAGSQAPPVLKAEGRSSLTPGNIYTIAGQVENYCNDGPSSCTGTVAAYGSVLAYPYSISVDAAGNVYILDWSAYMVRVIYAGGTVPPLLAAEGTTSPTRGDMYDIVGNNNVAGDAFNPCSTAPCGDGGKAADIQFLEPDYMTVDASGNLYIGDMGEYAIRKIDYSGYVSTIAGEANPNQTLPASGSASYTAGGGNATSTQLSIPSGIAFNSADNLYIADAGYNLVWQVTPALSQTITFPALETSATYGVSPITLGATASSGLDVYYSVTGPASIVCPSGSATPNSSNTAYTCPGNSADAELKITGAGTVTVTASQPGGTVTAENGSVSVYAPATAASGTTLAQTITVGKAPLTVTANSFSVTYGQFDPTVAGFYSASYNFVNNDTAATAFTAGSLSFSTTPTVTASSPQGTYTINVSSNGLTSTNYDVADATYVSGTLTITGNTPQTIQNFQPFTPITYGQVTTINLASLGVTASSGGPVTFTVSGGPGKISGSTLTITGAGRIKVVASQNGYEQYEVVNQEQDLVVNPAPLTVTAPALTYTYPTVIATALASASPKVTDPQGNDISAQVTCNACLITNASGTPDAGKYSLTVASGGLTLASSIAADYTFTNFVAGSLTINQGSQTISYIAPSSITYGGFPTMTATTSAGLPITATVTGPLKFQSSNVTVPSTGSNTLEWNATGVGPATITLTQAGTTDYAAATPVVLSFTIAQAPLDITAVSYTREEGAANPTFTYQIGTTTAGAAGGFQNGDTDIPTVVSGLPVLTTTATQASLPGTYTIAVDTSAMTSTNYYFAPINGTLTVTQPGTYAITANPSSLTIQRGLSAQSTITITPSNEYQGTITLSCGTLPANVTCTISPSTYTFTGEYVSNGYTYQENPQKGTITINSTSATVVGANTARKSNVSLAGFLIPGAFAGLFLIFARKRVAKIATFWSLCALLALGLGTLAITSCGGSSGLTTATPGTVTVTITGSGTTPSGSGTVTATVPLTVTIQ